MSTPSKTHRKDAPWMDDKYMPPNRGKSHDREHSDRYRRWSPSRRDSSSSWPRSDWKHDHRERYHNRQSWNYNSKPYRHGEQRWSTYERANMHNTGPHPSERAPKERADNQQHDTQASATIASANGVSKCQGPKPSIVIKKAKQPAKNKQSARGPPSAEDFTVNNFITEHLANQFALHWVPQSNQPIMQTHNALINKIIADEAIRMLSSAASSNEPTALNEPCDDTESATPLAADSSNETTAPTPIGTESTPKPIASATVTADSALLQKSAEQVTRKLINQLTTMSKYNLKQMIDNPAGKYETALNKHAQNKLRAEVRKQLKNFNLADAVRAKESHFGSDVMAPDEAIDAEKIPAELLEQIGHALDLDFYDLSGAEPRDSTEGTAECSTAVVPNDQPAARDVPSANEIGNQDVSATQQVQTQTAENVNGGAEILAPEANTPGQLATGPAGVETEAQPLPAESTPPAKVVSFLRVSTVDELNKRIETTAENVAPISRLPQLSLIASPMLATSGTNVTPEITSTPAFTEPTVSVSSISGPPRTESNAPLDCPSKAPTSCVSLSSNQTSSAINPILIESGKGTQDHGQSNVNGESGEQSTPAGKKKAKSAKKSPKKNPTRPPTAEMGSSATVPTSAETAIAQPKPNRKPVRRDSVLVPSRPTIKPHMQNLKKYTPPTTSDGSATPVRNDHGNRFQAGPTNQPPSKGASKASRWDRERVLPKPTIAAPNGECTLRTKSPESVPISRRSPKSGNDPTEQRRGGGGKRTWKSHPPSGIMNEQRPSGNDGSAGKSSTSWNGGPKRPRYQQLPPEIATAGSVVDGSSSKEDNPQIHAQNTMEQGTASVISTSNEKEQGSGGASDIRILNVRSLVDAMPPTRESESAPGCELNVSSMDRTENPTTASTNEHAGDEVALNDVTQPGPDHADHADRLEVDNNTPISQPPQAVPAMILPDLITPAQQPFCMILDQMQSIDSQTMELFKRKMELDATIMKLNGERMEIDQQIVKLQNARDDQMNALRVALFLPFPTGSMQTNDLPFSISLNRHGDQVQDSLIVDTNVYRVKEINVATPGLGSDTHQNSQQQTGCSQERTIRRITKISGNSELMRIFQRRRLLSERSSDDNPTVEEGSTPNDPPASWTQQGETNESNVS